jgi:hypothetical protein
MYDIFAKLFVNISVFRFREKINEIFAKIGFFVFAKKNSRFPHNFLRKSEFTAFAKMFAKNIRDFCKNLSRKFAHFHMIFAFSRKRKNAFSFQP